MYKARTIERLERVVDTLQEALDMEELPDEVSTAIASIMVDVMKLRRKIDFIHRHDKVEEWRG